MGGNKTIYVVGYDIVFVILGHNHRTEQKRKQNIKCGRHQVVAGSYAVLEKFYSFVNDLTDIDPTDLWISFFQDHFCYPGTSYNDAVCLCEEHSL